MGQGFDDPASGLRRGGGIPSDGEKGPSTRLLATESRLKSRMLYVNVRRKDRWDCDDWRWNDGSGVLTAECL